MIYEFKNLNKHGNIRTRLIPWPNGKSFGINPKGFGPYVSVKIHKYEYKEPLLPPGLIVIGNQKYIIPTWTPVLMETELTDINWIKPKPKKIKVEKQEFQFESKSDPGHFYKVTIKDNKVDCTCSGKWRAKDRQCRHMKDVKKQLGL
tara:strand:+ start:599 stop:1039 length:441 start_codon:yes stop_codon:yes gene_type:complete